jgi:hypothetical protein
MFINKHAMNNLTPLNRHTRTLHVDFDSYADSGYHVRPTVVSSIIDTIENLRAALQTTLSSKDARPFLRASQKATSSLRILNDAGLIGTVIKLRAHFKSELQLDDLSLRRNIARLEAIGVMVIEALKGQGMVA